MISVSGNPGDRPRDQVPKKPALDVAGFVASFIPTAASVTTAEYEARLDVCATCIYRVVAPVGVRCASCGCFIAIKAALPAFHCPQSKWPGDPPKKD